MALSGDVLGLALKAAVDSVPVPPGGADDAYRQDVFKAMGAAIVSHITSSAVVIVPNVTAVTPGPGISGPGSGTIT